MPPAGFGPTFGERVADAAPTKEILTDTPLTGQEFGQTIAEAPSSTGAARISPRREADFVIELEEKPDPPPPKPVPRMDTALRCDGRLGCTAAIACPVSSCRSWW